MPRKLILLIFMLLYIYTLTFDIFLNQYFRIPTMLLFGVPLIILFGNIKYTPFVYGKEIVIIFLACFIFYMIGNSNIKEFAVNVLILTFCCLYFNYYVGDNMERFNYSVIIFFGCLSLSALILLFNQFSGSSIDAVRSKLIGAPINQSPSGIAASIFTFGYQLAALTGFIFIYSLTMRWKMIYKLLILFGCLLTVYLGMQRSVIVTFTGSVLLFLIFYYRSRAVYIIALATLAGVLISSRINLQDVGSGAQDNVLAKNERNAERGENRSGLIIENIKIFADYPYGLIFHGKSWGQATEDSHRFRNGLTSHNAYLMFVTYLGPFLGLGLLFLLYFRIYKIFKFQIAYIKAPENGMLLSLCFALIAVSLNACFHNAWFLNGNGPTVFLYFAVLHLNRINQTKGLHNINS